MHTEVRNGTLLLTLCLVGGLAGLTMDRGLAAESAPPLQSTHERTYDLWIQGGTVVDRTGGKRYPADVLISDGKIAYLGNTDGAEVQARRTIDARGKIVTPGHIDLHSHGDPLRESFLTFLAQGITTVVLGQDGVTAGYEGDPEPTLEQWRSAQSAGSVGSANEAAATLSLWMRQVEAHGSEVNIAALSGHGSLRKIAGVGNAPEPTSAQLRVMQNILVADLAAGAFGMSFGLEYPPGRYSQLAEQKVLGDLVGARGGIVMSHLRSEDHDKIGAAIDELLQIDAHVHVSHIKIVAGRRAEEAQSILQKFDDARAQGRIVTADIYPYLASASSLRFLYPEWAREESAYDVAVRSRRAELEAHLRKRVQERNGPEAILFVDGPHAGKRLSELAAQLHKPYEKVLIDDIGYGGPAQAHFLMSEVVQNVFLRTDHIGISTDGWPQPGHPRSAAAFVKVLEEHVGPPPKMSLERAVHKMSGLAGQILGLDRGVLREGGHADLVVLSPGELRSRATYMQTDLRPSGLDYVIVNGAIALEHGQPAQRPNGRLLRRTIAPRALRL